ncbi:hypothetical protein AMTR_s00050p00028120 [Amborella trichopoda]|uniref:Uncharacterized protein n=1 Tax=Amborella trichopoda TaxID=13333 RepID=W1PZ66_AMBTC|nr:hypothetical protein AMTR_s00050p00028120 [Amborella trichopoda]
MALLHAAMLQTARSWTTLKVVMPQIDARCCFNRRHFIRQHMHNDAPHGDTLAMMLQMATCIRGDAQPVKRSRRYAKRQHVCGDAPDSDTLTTVL